MQEILTRDTWPANTEVTAIWVPWDATYRDIVAFDTVADREAYFEQASCNGDRYYSKQYTYLRPNEPITLDVPYSRAYKYNYVAVTNPAQPVDDPGSVRTLYYFITGSEYASPQATMVTLQLDVVMTYQFDTVFGTSYLESGHLGYANSNLPDSVGQLTGETMQRYLTVPEGLDIGSDYVTTWQFFHLLNNDSGQFPGKIIVISSVDLTADPGTVESPNLYCAFGQSADGLVSGCNVYAFDYQHFSSFMAQGSSRSWVMQGIIAIYTFPSSLLTDGEAVEVFGVPAEYLGDSPNCNAESSPLFQVPNATSIFASSLGESDRSVYKAGTYPYTVFEISCLNGNSVYLKPQLVSGSNLVFHAICCALAPFARVGVFPSNYGLGDSESTVTDFAFSYRTPAGDLKTTAIKAGDFIDSAIWLSDFPQFSIVNNSYITYLASTANTRAFSYQSAGWTLAKSTSAADLAYDQASMGLSTNQANYDASVNGLIGNVANTVQQIPIVSDAINAAGSLVNPIAGAVGASGWSAQSIVNNLTGLTAQQNNQQLGYYNADTNRAFAEYANQGDYRNAIASINATVQDAALSPPSVVGQTGGDGFNWKNGLIGVWFRVKQANGAQMRGVIDFWRRYGYRVQRFVDLGGKRMKDLRVMEKFSYWRLKEAYLTCASANESETAAIRGVFEKGVTIWGNPDDIGNTPVNENPVSTANKMGY